MTATQTSSARADRRRKSPGRRLRLLNRGMDRHRAGDLGGAEGAYRKVLADHPEDSDALNLLGAVAQQRGQTDEAIALLEHSLALDPSNAHACVNLGVALRSAERLEAAAEMYRQALAIQPRGREALSNLGSVLTDLGKKEEAVEVYRSLHTLNLETRGPGTHDVERRIAMLCLDLEETEAAAEWFLKCAPFLADDPEVNCNTGYALESNGRKEEAEPYYRRAVELLPRSAELNSNYGNLLVSLGRIKEGEAYLKRAVEIAPDRWKIQANLAGTYLAQAEYDKAITEYEAIRKNDPDNVVANCDLAAAYGQSGRFDKAIPLLQRAIEIKPDYYQAYANLGNAYLCCTRLDEAIEAFHKCMEIEPGYVDAHVNLCLALKHANRLDEGNIMSHVTLLLEGYDPKDFPNLLQNFGATFDMEGIGALGDLWSHAEKLSHDMIPSTFLDMLTLSFAEADYRRLVALHRKWGEEEERRAARQPLAPLAPRGEGKIRVAFLSSDLRSHSVSKFILPLLEHYDHENFEIFCYATVDEPDDPVQQTVTGLVDRWTVVENQSLREIATTIREDSIDVLIDLNGFTRYGRVAVLAYKPARIQVSYLGYPFTYGLSTVDYVLVDGFSAPEYDWTYLERPLRMEGAWICFGNFPDQPMVEEPPFVANGFITFGTLNNPYKYNPEMVAAWAKVMSRVEDSRFLVVRPECASFVFRTHFLEIFERHGVSRERIEFVNNWQGSASYLSYYNRIDVALDTYPVTGGTTTCESLWMGVPTVARTGPCFHQRISSAILRHCGLSDLVTESVDDYVNTAVRLAGDDGRLIDLRRDLRKTVLASPLCDARGFARNFENAMRRALDEQEDGKDRKNHGANRA
jgi:predicted O-linked N-acetylglucosamine transferase (SPINDLY family)